MGQWHCLKVEVGLPCFLKRRAAWETADRNLMTIGLPRKLQVPGNYALDGTPVKLMRMHVSEAWLNSEYGGRPADWIGIGWITPFAYPGGHYYDT